MFVSRIAEVFNCSAQDGGAFFAKGGSELQFFSGELFRENRAISTSGALSVHESALAFSSFTEADIYHVQFSQILIRSNSAAIRRGGLSVVESSLISSHAEEVLHCNAQEGGGIVAENSSQIDFLSQVLLRNNQASIRGGVVVVEGGKMFFSEVIDVANCPSLDGGASYMKGGSENQVCPLHHSVRVK